MSPYAPERPYGPEREAGFGRGFAPSLRPWLERGLGWRDRLLRSPRFQRWAAGFPLTRPIARRRTRALFDLCAGFVYSQVLLACVQLRLFEILAEGPQSLETLSRRLCLAPEAAERLMRAATALGLAARRGRGRYGLGPHGAALAGNPGIAAMIEHHRLFYADLADPVALLRGEAGDTELSRYWPYAGAKPSEALSSEGVAPYTALMAASQPMIAAEVLAAYPLERHSCLLDVGGGDGSFLRAVHARAPDLRLMLFDLPPVAAQARARFAALGLSETVTVEGGNFLADPLPRGADIVSLVRVIHDHDDAAALAILNAVHRALPKDGRLLLAEPMSDTPGAEPMGDAYFAFYLLAMGRGRPRTPEALCRLLGDAGFGKIERLRTHNPLLTGALLASP